MFADASSGNGRFAGYIQYDHNTDTMLLATSEAPRLHLDSAEVTVNEGSYNTDFRVESDSSTHALFVNAENSRVGMNESNPDNTLHVKEGDNNDSANNIYADAFSSGAMLKLENAWTGVVPAAQQNKIAGTRMTTVSNAGYTASGQIHVESNAYSGYDAGDLVFATGFNTSALMTERLRMNQGEAVFNDTGANNDFRVESDTQSHALFVDAGNEQVGMNNVNQVCYGRYNSNFNGAWQNVVNMDTIGLNANRGFRIRVHSNENGRSNVGYAEYIGVANNTTATLVKVAEALSGNGHGHPQLQMSGHTLQIKNVNTSNIGSWSVFLDVMNH